MSDPYVGACPGCGAEPGCNIDCTVCDVWDTLSEGERWDLIEAFAEEDAARGGGG